MINDLVKIIKQAENNGFDLCNFCMKHKISFVGLCDGIVRYMNKRNMIDLLLLNKEFNKTYWGEESDEYRGRLFGKIHYPKHQFHLQQLVLEDNKVEYFKKGIKNE